MSQRDVISQCRIVVAELRGTNSDLKIGGGLVEIVAEFSVRPRLHAIFSPPLEASRYERAWCRQMASSKHMHR